MKTRLFLFEDKVVQKNLSQGIIGRYLHSCMVATLEKEQSQFGGDMFGKRPIILLLCFIYLCIQLPQTSWHSNSPDSALKMLGEFDLTSGNGLAVTFWHKFDLPPGSLGTVEASTDEGITWQSVYTQTTSLPNWAQVTLDLSQFAGHKVTLAFFLQEVGAGNFASDETSEQAVSIPTPIRSTFVNAFWSISLVLLGGIGLSLVGGKRRSHYLVLCLVGTGLLTTLAGCIQVGPSPDFDYNKLDLTKGEIELVVPAEQQILTAAMSPDGKWLFFMSSTDEDRLEQPGYYRHTLINLEQNQQYDLGISAARRRWVDAEHLAGNGVMLRVSDMVQWSLQSIEPLPGSLGELATAPHIYAIDGFGSTYALVSVDPVFPYSMVTNFSADAGVPNEELAAFLADRPHTIVMRDTSAGHNGHPVYSPDGQYYVEDGPFDEPPDNLTQAGSIIYDAHTSQEIAYGYKYSWNTRFLGWASDSSGVYIWFSPRSPTGDALYDQHPIYKVLVPGAEKQGLPEPVIITPSPLSQYTLPDVDTAWQETDKGILYHSLAQVSYSGWYIDDVTAIETDPPTPTPTATATPTITATPTATPDPSYGMCEYQGVGGTVVVEAEHYTSQTAGTGNAQWSSWVDTTHVPGYGGSRAVWAFPDNRVGTGL